MTSYRNTFMGNAGFDELKRYARQATEFGREIVNILNERAQVEQNHARALQRLGQRISKATSLILGSPLSNAWKTVGVEMEKESELHSELGYNLIEDCVKPLSMLTEGQIKPRRMKEQQVEATGKTWADRYAEHAKIKRRQHTTTGENETLIDQISVPSSRTDKDHQKLVAKQMKQDETVQRCNAEYYNSLLHLERNRQAWECASFECCDAAENMDEDRFRRLFHVIRKYTDTIYQIPSKMKTMCRTIDEATDDLSVSKEISVVSDKLRGVPYVAEQLLCDHYEENFSCQMSIDRRRFAVNKLLERYINDCQKERSHKDGLLRMQEKSPETDLSIKLNQSMAMLTFFEVIRYKLNCTLASLDGNTQPNHPLSNNIEHFTDKQGVLYSTLKLRPGEADEKMKQAQKSRSSKPKPSKHHSSSSYSSTSSHRSKSDQRNSNERKLNLPSQNAKRNSSSSSRDFKRNSKSSSPVPPPVELAPSLDVQDNQHNGTREILCHCVAIYDYAATRDDELSINEGDVIKVYEKGADDWWHGELNGKVGLFPANYVDTEISV